jgi:hypothetical protein
MAIDIAMKLYRGETVPAENLVEGEGIDKNTVDPAGSTTYRFEPGIIFIVPVRVGRDGIRSSYAFWN